jgi:hypothetical protein
MIARIWHGWTRPVNADAYEALLKEEIFVGIRNRHVWVLSGQRFSPGRSSAILGFWYSPAGSFLAKRRHERP